MGLRLLDYLYGVGIVFFKLTETSRNESQALCISVN